MKITFTQTVEPCLMTGNEFYPVGSKADLRHGCELVAIGVAREGWMPPAPPAPVEPPAPEPEPEAELAPKAKTPRKRTPAKRKTSPRKKTTAA